MVAGTDLVAWTLGERGKPYVWGAEGPQQYDCSGLMYAAAHHFGLSIPRTTEAMYGKSSNLIAIDRKDLQPGDLVLSSWKAGDPVSHVAMWVGDGSVVEAPEPGSVVRTTPYGAGYAAHTVGYRRIPGVNGAAAGGSNPIQALAGLIPGWLPTPSNLTDATQNVAAATAGLAESARSFANVADLVVQMFTPSGILRGFSFMFGVMFLLIGIWFLAREVRESQGG